MTNWTNKGSWMTDVLSKNYYIFLIMKHEELIIQLVFDLPSNILQIPVL